MKSLKTQTGVVVSNKMDKTAVVEITRRVKHSIINKYYNKRRRFKVHDEKNECQIGDKVEIKESRPISASKRWVVCKIVEKAVVA